MNKKPPIIIGGCPRSGTTLFRCMLDSHPNIFSGVELGLVMTAASGMINSWERNGERATKFYNLTEDDFVEAYGGALRELYDKIRDRKQVPRIADKMPQSVQHFKTLSWMLPEARFIHVIRDGRDVACSLVNHDVEMKDQDGNRMPFSTDRVKGMEYWRWITNRGLMMRNHPNSERYYEIHYEDLVENTEKELRDVLDFLDEPWDANVLEHYNDTHQIDKNQQAQNPPNSDSIGRWKREMTEEEKGQIDTKIGETLKLLNYGSS